MDESSFLKANLKVNERIFIILATSTFIYNLLTIFLRILMLSEGPPENMNLLETMDYAYCQQFSGNILNYIGLIGITFVWFKVLKKYLSFSQNIQLSNYLVTSFLKKCYIVIGLGLLPGNVIISFFNLVNFLDFFLSNPQYYFLGFFLNIGISTTIGPLGPLILLAGLIAILSWNESPDKEQILIPKKAFPILLISLSVFYFSNVISFPFISTVIPFFFINNAYFNSVIISSTINLIFVCILLVLSYAVYRTALYSTLLSEENGYHVNFLTIIILWGFGLIGVLVGIVLDLMLAFLNIFFFGHLFDLFTVNDPYILKYYSLPSGILSRFSYNLFSPLLPIVFLLIGLNDKKSLASYKI